MFQRSRSHSYSGAKTPSQLTQQFKKETEELNCLTSPPDPWVFLQKVTSIQSCTTTNNIEPVALISRANSIDNDDEISSHSSTNLAFSPIGKFQKSGGVTTTTKRRLSIKEYPEIPTFTADNFSTLHTLCASNPSIDIIRM